MYLTATFHNEQLIEGIVSAAGWRGARVAIPGQVDGIDLCCDAKGQWMTVEGALISIPSSESRTVMPPGLIVPLPTTLSARPWEE